MEPRSFRERTERTRLGIGAALLSIFFFGPLSVSAENNGAESAKGLSPHSTFATSGIDRVNVFNGNVVLEIPIGPDYPIGSDLSQQLRLVYNSQIWQSHNGCEYVDPTQQPPPPPTTYYGFHVTGSSVLGAGWRLDFGRLDEGDTTSWFKYVAPDGGVHQLEGNTGLTDWRSVDRTYLRSVNPVFALSNPPRSLQQADVLFPDGHTGQFRQIISSVPHGSTLQDFDSEGIYLTRLSNRRGDWVEVAYLQNYEVADGAWRIATVKHYAQGVLIPSRTINFHYTTVTVDTRPWAGTTVDTWTVLSEIDFPTVSSQTQRMLFSYYTDGFARPDTDVTYRYCGASATRREAAAPLLKRVQLDSGDPTLFYDFDYYRTSTGVDTRSGALKQLTLPAGGVVQYQWAWIGSGSGPLTTPPELSFLLSGLTGVSRRTEYPEGLSGSSGAWTYSYSRLIGGPPNNYAQNEVTAPDLYRTRHYFYLDPGSGGNGLEYRTETFDLGGHLTRREERCYDDDETHTNVCAGQFANDFLRKNARVSRDDVSVFTGAGAIAQTRSVLSSSWDGYGHFGSVQLKDWNGALLRTTATIWAPDTVNWILDEFRQETVTDSSAPAGQQVRTRYAEFDSTGFLKGTFTYDPSRALAFLNCRYPDGGGNLQKEFTATLTNQTSAPAYDICSRSYSTMPSVGSDSDMFGRFYTYQYGQLLSKRWMQGTSPAAWFELDLYRDPVSGDQLVSWDVAAQPSYYGYDQYQRLKSSAPPGNEAGTYVTYDTPTQSTVTKGSGSSSIWSRAIIDGFGRPKRDIRKLPGGYSARLQSYDAVGRTVFASEWATCADPMACAGANVTAGNRVSSFDPFGRPQTATGPDGSARNISYGDGSVPFSDTQRSWTVNNINGSCSGGACSGGTSATTVHRYDALGRIVSTAEPGVATPTTYVYEVGGNVASVTQGGQTRTFAYDPVGNLRSQNTPERGLITYDRYGSVGNVLQESHSASGLVRAVCYDFAGRPLGIRTNEDGVAPQCSPAVGRLYLQLTYNDSSAGPSLGRLVSRSAVNYATSPATTVLDSYLYNGVGGRLSDQTTSVSGASAFTATQRWLYNNLALVAHHYHPSTGGTPFVVSTLYDSGLPVAEYGNGIPVVTGVSYQPSGALRSYSTGVGIGSNVTTTATYDASATSRITGISTSGASANFVSGAYTYDGAASVTGIGVDRFTYDSLSRLTQSNLAEGSEAYTYDQFGNLLSKGATTFCTGSCAGNKVPSKTYDPRGNLTGDSGQPPIYTYDGMDRAIRRNLPSIWGYVFDGKSERIAKIPPTGAWTYTLRDGNGRIVSEYSGAARSRENVYLAGRLVASYASSAVTGNGPVWTFYTNDHLWTPRMITDLGGAVVEARKYRPYGEDLGTPSLFQRVRFASMERDAEGTSYQDHARNHDYSIGRFLTPDDVPGNPADPQSWNRYTYARSNPVLLADRTGLQVEGQGWFEPVISDEDADWWNEWLWEQYYMDKHTKTASETVTAPMPEDDEEEEDTPAHAATASAPAPYTTLPQAFRRAVGEWAEVTPVALLFTDTWRDMGQWVKHLAKHALEHEAAHVALHLAKVPKRFAKATPLIIIVKTLIYWNPPPPEPDPNAPPPPIDGVGQRCSGGVCFPYYPDMF